MLPIGKAWKHKQDIRIGTGCKVHNLATLFGPLVIGNKCVIEVDARVGEATILGKNVKVRKHVSIERSVIWDDVTIETGAKIASCIIGKGCKIGRFVTVSPGSVIGDHAVIPAYSRV